MQAEIVTDNLSKTINFDGTESDLFRQAGELIPNLPVPNYMDITVNGYTAGFRLLKRGTFSCDGTRDADAQKPAVHISGQYNNIPYGVLKSSNYPEAELRCVNPGSGKYGNYKRYHLFPKNNTGELECGYNGIQEKSLRMVQGYYPLWLYWPLYYEKIQKGYVDVTDLIYGKVRKHLNKKTTVSSIAAKTDTRRHPDNEELYNRLMQAAHQTVKNTLVSPVTEKQVQSAKAEFVSLCKMKSVKGFNRHLAMLMALSPRKRDPLGDDVNDMFAKKADDFTDIIKREENLLQAMEGSVLGSSKPAVDTNHKSFYDYGIHVWKATDEQRKKVLEHIEPSFRSRVVNIWRVKPEKQEQKMRAYAKKHGIKKFKLLWHGSHTASWAAITINSLDMNYTHEHGTMLGAANYTAPSFAKSFNYTDTHGTTWAHGTAKTGFLGLFTCAYGNPWFVSNTRSYSKDEVEKNGYNCVHATKANTWLRADEVAFYDNDAVCLSYIVEVA